MQPLEWITDQTRFSAIAPEWDRLAQEARTPFLSSAWVNGWCRAFGARRRLVVAALWRDGELAGGVPLLAGWRRWDAPANDHSPAFGLLAADAEARARLVAGVLTPSKALTVPGLAEDESTLAVLLKAARRERRLTLVEPMDTSLVVDTAGTFQQYRAGMSAKVRSELGRLRRKIEREHAFDLTALAEPVDLEDQLTRAFSVEASGWKGRAGTAIICSPDTERFYRGVARDFHAAGTFRISELSLDGQLAATALSIIHGQRVFTLKVGYDERHRRLGPGLVLLTAMIERCFELGLEAYEFSGPDEEYERRFATGQRAHHRVRIYPRDPVNAARYTYHRRVRPRLRTEYRRARHAGLPDPRAARRPRRRTA